MNAHTQRGLTLLETLIAALLLFTALSLVTLAYRNATITSLKAEAVIARSQSVPNIVEIIREQLERGVQKGAGELNGQRYNWQAKVLQRRNVVGGYDVSAQQPRQESTVLNLLEIQLTIAGRAVPVYREML